MDELVSVLLDSSSSVCCWAESRTAITWYAAGTGNEAGIGRDVVSVLVPLPLSAPSFRVPSSTLSAVASLTMKNVMTDAEAGAGLVPPGFPYRWASGGGGGDRAAVADRLRLAGEEVLFHDG